MIRGADDISCRYYLFIDDGSLRRVPQRILEALPFGADAIPEFAGTRQRAAHFILELRNAKPFRILDARGAYWEFDAEGRVDEHIRQAVADRFELMAPPRPQGPVVDLVPEIKLRERIDKAPRKPPLTEEGREALATIHTHVAAIKHWLESLPERALKGLAFDAMRTAL